MHRGEVGGGERLTLFPWRSSCVSPSGRNLAFGSLPVVTVAISLGFAMHGAWPVVPFAGLECLGLYIACRWLKRHRDDYQCVSVDDQTVVVQSREGDKLRRNEFSRARVQVVVEDRPDGRSSVFLRAHGRAVEIGKWLTEERRDRGRAPPEAADLRTTVSDSESFGGSMRFSAFVRLMSLGAALVAPGVAAAGWQLNLQTPNSVVAKQVYDLHTLIMWIITVIFVGVFGFMFYAIIRHRKSLGYQAAHFHENATVEMVWTIVPFLILVGMAWPATRTLLQMRDAGQPDLTIKATGYQWKWGYEYLDDGIKFYSTLATPRDQIEGPAQKGADYLLEVDNPVVVPVGKKVRVLTTANDVLHAWYVPALAVKQDAIPGFIRDTWFRAEKTGVYRGQCAELCGKEHGFMPIVVKVVTEDEYKAWVAQHKQAATAAAR